MKELPQDVSESTKRRNPHLYPNMLTQSAETYRVLSRAVDSPKPPKRIRQSSKPLMNRLEQEWFDHLRSCGGGVVRAQAVTFKLANGLRYTPDMLSFGWPSDYEDGIVGTVWEVKGSWFTDDSNAKLKMFATAYPEIRVLLVWKDAGKFQTQRVLP